MVDLDNISIDIDINDIQNKYLLGPGSYSKSIALYCKQQKVLNNIMLSVVFTHILFWEVHNTLVEKKDNFVDGKYRVYFSYSKIAEMLGDIKDRNTIKRAVEQLHKLGLIEILPKSGCCNWYSISEKGLEIAKYDYYWVLNNVKYYISKSNKDTSNKNSTQDNYGSFFDGVIKN